MAYKVIDPSELDKPTGGYREVDPGPSDDVGMRAVGTSALSGVGGVVQGARDTANPLSILSLLAKYGTPLPGQTAQKALGVDKTVSNIGNWAERNAPVTDPLQASYANNPDLYKNFQSATGMDVEKDLSTPEKAVAARGGEMTPLRDDLGAAGRAVGASIVGAPASPLMALLAGVGAGTGRHLGRMAGNADLGETIGSLGVPTVGAGLKAAATRMIAGGPKTQGAVSAAVADARRAGLEIPSMGQAAIDVTQRPSWTENMLSKLWTGPAGAKQGAEVASANRSLADFAGQAYRPLDPSIAGNLYKSAIQQGKATALGKVTTLENKVAQGAQGIATPLTEYENTLQSLTNKNPATTALVPGAVPSGIQEYADRLAQFKKTGQPIPFETSEAIRKSIGKKIGDAGPNAITPDGADVAALKKLYSSILDDQRSALVSSSRPDLVQTFDAKRRLYSSLMGQPGKTGSFQILEPLASAKSGEDVVQMLQNWAVKNPTEFKTAISFMPKDQRGLVSSQVLAKIGRSPQGEFSFDRFRSDWNKLGEAGGQQDTIRRALFDGPMGPDYRKGLDAFFRYADRASRASKVLLNPPKSGDVMANVGVLGAVGSAIASGSPLAMAGAATSIGASKWLIGKMMDPKFVSKFANPQMNGQFIRGELARGIELETNPDTKAALQKLRDAVP